MPKPITCSDIAVWETIKIGCFESEDIMAEEGRLKGEEQMPLIPSKNSSGNAVYDNANTNGPINKLWFNKPTWE